MNFKETVFGRLRKVSRSPGVVIVATRFVLHGVRLIIDGSRSKDKTNVDVKFYPGKPSFIYALWGMCHVIGVPVRHGKNGKTVVFFADTTYVTKPLPDGADRWINGKCTDIRKSTVSNVQEKVFGHALDIDPTAHEGEAVEKSEINGAHDGIVVHCPLKKPKEGKAYQHLIDNEVSPGMVEDLRTVVVGDGLVLVYRKRRKKEMRFLNTNTEVVIAKPKDVFSEKETETIKRYAKEVGLDIGELDILRDKNTQKLFVVDVTTTSMSPPIRLPYRVRRECLQKIGEAFRKEFINGK